MHDIESLVGAYVTAERDLVAAVDAAAARCPCPTAAPSWAAPSSTRCWAGVVSGRGSSSEASADAGPAMRERWPRVREDGVGSLGRCSRIRYTKINLRSLRATPGSRVATPGLRQIDGVTLQIRELAILQRGFVGRAKHHARRLSCFERFLPARRAETPAVAGLKPLKAEFRHRR
jgi:hypothetical protein